MCPDIPIVSRARGRFALEPGCELVLQERPRADLKVGPYADRPWADLKVGPYADRLPLTGCR